MESAKSLTFFAWDFAVKHPFSRVHAFSRVCRVKKIHPPHGINDSMATPKKLVPYFFISKVCQLMLNPKMDCQIFEHAGMVERWICM